MMTTRLALLTGLGIMILVLISYTLYVILTSFGDYLTDDENCGLVPPIVKHKLYNGQSVDVQSWPWNVI